LKAVLQPFTTTSHFLAIISSQRTTPVFSRVMGDQSGSTHFRAHFESAFQAYEKNTGVILAEHPLAVQLHNCHDIESIIRVFSDFRGNDRIMKLIERIVSMLSMLSTTTALGMSIGVVRQKALMGCFAPDRFL